MTRKTKLILSAVIIACLASAGAQVQPPFAGTIFLDSDIIVDSDPTMFSGVAGAGRGTRSMFDRRVNNWVSLNAYLVNASYSDGPNIEVQVNPEFGNAAAALAEAAKYGPVIGRLPACLRTSVKTVWIHKGTQPFGGGNNNLLIHTGQADQYAVSGILEETLVHEATHTSLDALYAGAPGWIAAQNADGKFISSYARDYPSREDLAETFLVYFALRHRLERISVSLANTISQTIPRRIAYLDSLNLNMKPTVPFRPLKLTDFIHGGPAGSFSLTWASRPGVHYAIDISPNLVGWMNLIDDIPSQGISTTYRDSAPLPPGQAFLVVREFAEQ